MDAFVEIFCMICSFIENGFDSEIISVTIGCSGALGFLDTSCYLLLPSGPKAMFLLPICSILYGFPSYLGTSRKPLSRDTSQSHCLDLQIAYQPVPPRDPSTRKNIWSSLSPNSPVPKSDRFRNSILSSLGHGEWNHAWCSGISGHSAYRSPGVRCKKDSWNYG